MQRATPETAAFQTWKHSQQDQARTGHTPLLLKLRRPGRALPLAEYLMGARPGWRPAPAAACTVACSSPHRERQEGRVARAGVRLPAWPARCTPSRLYAGATCAHHMLGCCPLHSMVRSPCCQAWREPTFCPRHAAQNTHIYNAMPCSTSSQHGRQPVQKRLAHADARTLAHSNETLQVSRVRPRRAAKTLVTQHALHPVTAFSASKEPLCTALLGCDPRSATKCPKVLFVNSPNPRVPDPLGSQALGKLKNPLQGRERRTPSTALSASDGAAGAQLGPALGEHRNGKP